MTIDRRGRVATTSIHASLRATVRGGPLPEGGPCVVGGIELLILGLAKPSDWLDAELHKGDLEAVAWSAPKDAERVAAALLADDHVVALRTEAETIDVE